MGQKVETQETMMSQPKVLEPKCKVTGVECQRSLRSSSKVNTSEVVKVRV